MFKRFSQFIFRILKLLFTLLLLGVLWFCLHTAYSTYIGTRTPSEQADVAVIMGAMVLPDGSLSRWLRLRTQAGLELYQQGLVKKIIVSGGKGVEGHYEGNSMRAYLIAHGVPSEDIIVDNAGINTYNTAKNYIDTAQEHQFKSVIIVSHYYHIARTTQLFKRLGIKNVQGYAPPVSDQPDLYYLPREFAAFYYYLLMYRS